jgi:hypothetical protein
VLDALGAVRVGEELDPADPEARTDGLTRFVVVEPDPEPVLVRDPRGVRGEIGVDPQAQLALVVEPAQVVETPRPASQDPSS